MYDTKLARAQVGTLRIKLFKVGAVVLRNMRRIRFLLSSMLPYQHLFYIVVKRLVPGQPVHHWELVEQPAHDGELEDGLFELVNGQRERILNRL